MLQTVNNTFLTKFATIFIILYGIYYVPIDSFATNAPIKNSLCIISILVLFAYTFKISKALVIGVVYFLYQLLSASFHPESWRWGTLFYSAILVFSYICIYNLVTIEKIFSIQHFIKICKWMMMAYFVVCIIQQILTIIGITPAPFFNLMYTLDRGIGCQSLSLEPSHFARIMLVFYYAYIKCSEYKRGEGPFTLKEFFTGERKWVTIRFLWMMLTMGSGTAFVCLILFSLYFVRRNNWYYVIPMLMIGYSLIQASGIEALDRATSTIEATTTLNSKTVMKADGSASARIAPVLNSLNADFSDIETWIGKGIDSKNTVGLDKVTIFNDYGFILYLISLLFNFTCAYNFWSLATVFMFAGVGGGSGGNIQLAWELMIVMTCVKYFHDNRFNPEIYEENEEEMENLEINVPND